MRALLCECALCCANTRFAVRMRALLCECALLWAIARALLGHGRCHVGDWCRQSPSRELPWRGSGFHLPEQASTPAIAPANRPTTSDIFASGDSTRLKLVNSALNTPAPSAGGQSIRSELVDRPSARFQALEWAVCCCDPQIRPRHPCLQALATPRARPRPRPRYPAPPRSLALALARALALVPLRVKPRPGNGDLSDPAVDLSGWKSPAC